MAPLYRRLTLCGLLFAACLVGGLSCASTPTTLKPSWPTTNVLPTSPPEGLKTDAPTSLLRRGSDGFLYAVGGLPDDVERGSPFLARYSGDWPLDNTPRPALATGRVLRTFGEQAALVHLTYRMPDTSPEELEVTWNESAVDAPVGKGVFEVDSTSGSPVDSVMLDFADRPEAESGDVFALLRDGRDAPSTSSLQLSRRFRGLCRIEGDDEGTTRCRILGLAASGSSVSPPQPGDQALFLEHRLDKKPREAAIDVATVDNGSEQLQTRLADALDSFVGERSNAKTKIHRLETSLDATRPDFYRTSQDVEFRGGPQVLVGASVRERQGRRHLMVNYTGVGPAVGAGLVAAPPNGGTDLGPVDELQAEDLQSFAAVVWASVLIHRGQNSRALLHIHNLLSDPELDGPLRWHMRDQYAMEWGAFGHYGEALWLVLQDETIAQRADRRRARLNAMGTRVRLYDFLERPERAVDLARRYLEEQAEAAASTRLSALGMYAEMLAKHEEYDRARKVVERLQSHCPEGCRGDLASYLISISWVTSRDKAPELHDTMLEQVIALTEQTRGRPRAAARILQGIHYLERESFEQGLIAFLEAARLYRKAGDLVGLARSKHFVMLSQLRRDNFKNAIEAGRRELELRRQIRDFEGLSRAYERLANAFSTRDARQNPKLFLRAARGVLSRGYRIQRARGDFGKASKSLFVFASFLQRFGQTDQASRLFKRAVAFGLSSTRFDIAALSHLYLGLIARQNNDRATFQREIRRARLLAPLADDPRIEKTIERALESKPSQQQGPPTQLL